jgi:hypothetical protein
VPDFVDWIHNPLAYGKTTSTSSTVLYLNKFRTTIGKWSVSLHEQHAASSLAPEPGYVRPASTARTYMGHFDVEKRP